MRDNTQASHCIQILRELIPQHFHIKNNDNEIKITELNPQTDCSQAIIKSSMTLETFSFSIDQPAKKGCGDPIYPFLNCGALSGICKKNDGIIFVRRQNEIHVFLLELKSRTQAEYLPQLKAAKLFVGYFLSLLALNGHCLKQPDSIRCIRFIGRRIPQKGTTKKHMPLSFDRRDTLEVIDWPCSKPFHLLAALRSK